jgi:signal transduction histidine kinase
MHESKDSQGMLHEFVTANRDEIIARCRSKIALRPVPRPTDLELQYGVPLFLDQLAETLRLTLVPDSSIADTGAKHANELLDRGFTIAQVVHDYGGICQSITELADETSALITLREFQMLNLCLDDAIAGAVTEYGRLREHEGTERLGRLSHELRNLLNTSLLAFDVLKTGSVGVGGSTGAVLARSLGGLRNLLDRELAEVRLGAGILHRETVVVCDFIEDVEVAATMDANARGLEFSVSSVTRDITISADRQILTSVVGNLLQNAFKFTRSGSRVSLRAQATADRVRIEIEDQCGGLPAGKVEELFHPFEQMAADRTGLGLGLDISRRGARVNDGTIRVHNHAGVGCTFTVDLPRTFQTASA